MASKSAAAVLPAHGGQLRAIAAQFGVPEYKLLDFSASIYPDGPSPKALEALADALRNPERIRAYPDLESLELRNELATYANVPVGNVLVASGMASLLSATLRAIYARKCMLPVPAFGEYRRTLNREGVGIETDLLSEQARFQPNLQELLTICVRRGCDTLLLTNPHNPTGLLLSRTELQILAQNAEIRGIRILLDEAFIDFVPEESLSSQVPESNHLIVFRSVTKFFAMAGMRVAYMIAPRRIIGRIRDLLDPWPISTLASIATIAAIHDTGYIRSTVARNRREREELCSNLARLTLTVYPSSANFLFFRIGSTRQTRNIWERLILEHGIVTRNCATFEGLDEAWFRASVRGRKDNLRLVEALDAVLNHFE
jgi:threonine-phosphate decarboxylase